MHPTRTELILALLQVPGLGPRTLSGLLQRADVLRWTAEDVLRRPASELRINLAVPPRAAQGVACLSAPQWELARSQAALMRRCGVRLLEPADVTYPARLVERMPVPPPIIFAYGTSSCLARPTLAVANSNRAPEAALAACDSAAALAVAIGHTLVTGHNRAPYQRPALVARRSGGPVCYALDRGMLEAFGGDLTRALFPAARIWGPDYDPQTDLALSPFPLEAHGIAANNRVRDTLVFALADQIVAGWVRPGGQMERECLEALAAGRPVWLATGANPPLESAGARALKEGCLAK